MIKYLKQGYREKKDPYSLDTRKQLGDIYIPQVMSYYIKYYNIVNERKIDQVPNAMDALVDEISDDELNVIRSNSHLGDISKRETIERILDHYHSHHGYTGKSKSKKSKSKSKKNKKSKNKKSKNKKSKSKW